MGALSNKGGRGQRNHEEFGAGATLFFSRLRRSCARLDKTAMVHRAQYGISALVSQTSFGGEASGSVAKFWLFSQARLLETKRKNDKSEKKIDSI